MRSRSSQNRLPRLVQSFFRDHLQRVRGASPHTIRAYRDTLRLLFMFLADTNDCSVADLRTTDLCVDHILMFLSHLETGRGNSVTTRNCRLAAIRSFFSHLIRHDPASAEQYYRILALPVKKARIRLATYLEPEDVRGILDKPDHRTQQGIRDRALLLFLYNTGARVSEALAVRYTDVKLDRPRQVLLHGKGGKDRLCPLWRDTASALKRLINVQPGETNGYFFRNGRGEPLTRDGVAYILEKYVVFAKRDNPGLGRVKVTPHVLRHSCAVALLQAGVDVTVIRDYLGHASVATTSRYITTNLKMKREALEAFWKRTGIQTPRSVPWQPKRDLLAFLASL